MSGWRYTPSDFVLFSARAYEGLVESYNTHLWPLHGLAVVAGLAVVVLLQWRRTAVAAGVLAAAWLWVGWAFLLQRYASIQWAAPAMAAAFALQAVLIVLLGPRLQEPSRAGIVLYVLAVVAYPLIAALLGRPWSQAEVFGISPDPTAVATLALVRRGSRRVLMPIPLLWCAYSSATLWVLQTPHWWVPVAAAASAAAVAVRQRPALK